MNLLERAQEIVREGYASPEDPEVVELARAYVSAHEVLLEPAEIMVDVKGFGNGVASRTFRASSHQEAERKALEHYGIQVKAR